MCGILMSRTVKHTASRALQMGFNLIRLSSHRLLQLGWIIPFFVACISFNPDLSCSGSWFLLLLHQNNLLCVGLHKNMLFLRQEVSPAQTNTLSPLISSINTPNIIILYTHYTSVHSSLHPGGLCMLLYVQPTCQTQLSSCSVLLGGFTDVTSGQWW